MYSSPSFEYSPTLTQGLASLPQSYAQGYKEGGLARMAQKVEAAGRNGDTMLAHITPQEALMLRRIGGSGTINPQTGLPEFFLKKLISAVAKIIKPLAPLIPFMNFIPGIGPLSALATKALLTGIASGANKDGSFDFKRGLTSGALSYGIGSLTAGASGTGGTGGVGDVSGVEAAASSADAASAGADLATGDPYILGSQASDFAQAASAPSSAAVGIGDISALGADQVSTLSPGVDDGMASPGGSGVSNVNPAPGRPPAEIVSGVGTSSYQGMTPEQMTAARSAENARLPGAVFDNVVEAGKAVASMPIKDTLQTAGAGLTAYGTYLSYEEKKKLEEEAKKIEEKQAKEKAENEAFARDVMDTYQPEFRRPTAEDIKSMNFTKGGIANLKKSKKSARFLTGRGDGMSDSIRATIEGKQKARLSDGEFVVPADVVSHLGNGSSQAGAKKLYDMMSRLRQARTGKNKQAPAVKTERYMPA